MCDWFNNRVTSLWSKWLGGQALKVINGGGCDDAEFKMLGESQKSHGQNQ